MGFRSPTRLKNAFWLAPTQAVCAQDQTHSSTTNEWVLFSTKFPFTDPRKQTVDDYSSATQFKQNLSQKVVFMWTFLSLLYFSVNY